MDRRCLTCEWYVAEHSHCHEGPHTIEKRIGDWCSRWKEKKEDGGAKHETIIPRPFSFAQEKSPKRAWKK